jgi:hypothetical protein
MIQGYQLVQGTQTAAQGSATKDVIAAQGTGTVIRLTKAVVSVTVVATGGGGEVALTDGAGGTDIFRADADALGVFPIDLGEGYPLTSNTLLRLIVSGAAGNQATAVCSAVGYVAR